MAWWRRGVVLALGGGGARGFAHVGVLEVLEQAGIRVRAIVGVSAGSVAGAGYALGRTPAQMAERILAFAKSRLATDGRVRSLVEQAGEHQECSWGDRLERLFCRGRVMKSLVLGESVLGPDYFRAVVHFFLPEAEIESLPLPFAAVASDILSGQPVVLREGSLRKAVLASCSVPGAAPVVEHQGRKLVDGGVVCLVPVRLARDLFGAPVVAVNVEQDIGVKEPPELALETYFRASEIQAAMLNRLQLEAADFIIRPQVGDIHWADFMQAERILEEGRQAARQALPQLRRLLRPRLWPWNDKAICHSMMEHG